MRQVDWPVVLLLSLLVGLALWILVRVIGGFARNITAPEWARPAWVAAKRQDVQSRWGLAPGLRPSSTDYYVTFQLADGSREEYSVNGKEFGMLAEGDAGVLYTQGDWFMEFRRQG